MKSLFAAVLFLAGIATTTAAPNVPASEQPGRERQRFQESPVERFMQPMQQASPLIQWQCEPRKPRLKKPRGRRTAC